MPILNDLLSHEVIGPAILQGRREGVQEIVRTLISKRFGSVPDWVDSRITNLSVSELNDIAVRLLDAPSLEVLFPSSLNSSGKPCCVPESLYRNVTLRSIRSGSSI